MANEPKGDVAEFELHHEAPSPTDGLTWTCSEETDENSFSYLVDLWVLPDPFPVLDPEKPLIAVKDGAITQEAIEMSRLDQKVRTPMWAHYEPDKKVYRVTPGPLKGRELDYVRGMFVYLDTDAYYTACTPQGKLRRWYRPNPALTDMRPSVRYDLVDGQQVPAKIFDAECHYEMMADDVKHTLPSRVRKL